jgi:hypothetical protein
VSEISHQTDPDTVIVVLVVGRPATVGAPFLFFPAPARLDVPIWPALTAVDDEMVPQFVPTAAAVSGIKHLGVTVFTGAVVDDDVTPLTVSLGRPEVGRLSSGAGIG